MMNNLIGISAQIKCGKDLIGDMIMYIGECNGRNVPAPFSGFEYNRKYNTHYHIKKCADKLKDCVCIILGCTRAQLEDQDFKSKELSEEWWCYKLSDGTLLPRGYYTNESDNEMCEERYLIKPTPRLFLQVFGTQGGRMLVHPNIWVNSLFADYKDVGHWGEDTHPTQDNASWIPKFPHWIITDVRFPENEGRAVLDRGGLMIGVRRLFRLRFPEYANLIDSTMDGHAIPEELKEINPELYKNLTHESETEMGDHSWCDVVIDNDGTIEELFNNVLKAVQWGKES